MKSKYQCPYCQYMSSRKWNVQNHVRNVHRIKDFPNGSNEKPQIYQQKKFHTKSECENQSENKVLRCLCEPSQPCHAEIQQQFAIQMGKNKKYEICIDISVDKRLCNENKQ